MTTPHPIPRRSKEEKGTSQVKNLTDIGCFLTIYLWYRKLRAISTTTLDV